jgi:hypothetical protein
MSKEIRKSVFLFKIGRKKQVAGRPNVVQEQCILLIRKFNTLENYGVDRNDMITILVTIDVVYIGNRIY